MSLQLHLLTSSPYVIIPPAWLGLPLTVKQVQYLDALAIQGRGYHGMPIDFQTLPSQNQVNLAVLFGPATADWLPLSHWIILDRDTNNGPTGFKCMGFRDFNSPLVVNKGERAELPAKSLFIGITSHGQVSPNIFPLNMILHTPTPAAVPGRVAMWGGPVAPNPYTWVTMGSAPEPSPPTAKAVTSGCECGAEKTWGPGAGGHSSWCPRARR